MTTHLTIGKLARAVDVPIDTVRYYERQGLMPAPVRGANGYRHYDAADLERLRFIRQAQKLGFTLAEIGRLLELVATDGARADVRALAGERLADIDQRLAELQRHRVVLSKLIETCSGRGTVSGCPIIEAVINPDDTAENP